MLGTGWQGRRFGGAMDAPCRRHNAWHDRIVSGNRTVAFEFMRIAVNMDDMVEFIASPSGQETARFKMVSMNENEVVFENPEHDFPTRIIYQLMSDGSLLGRIEGIDKGTPRTAEFPMTRTECVSGD
jgi:hypothetical protein